VDKNDINQENPQPVVKSEATNSGFVAKILYFINHLSKKQVMLFGSIGVTALILTGFLVFFNLKGASSVPSAPEEKSATEKANNKKQNLNVFFGEYYSEICERNKPLAYDFLKKHISLRGIKFELYKIKNGENFWAVAKKYGVNIDTVIGANPELTDLKSRRDQEIIVFNARGVLHEIKPNTPTDINQIATLYEVRAETIKKVNRLPFMLGQRALIFIPEGKPKNIKPELAALYKRRKMFRSPLAGKYTSLKGLRNDPVLRGVTKFHNGVDIRAKIGTWVGAAADGVVESAGLEPGFGNCIRIKHANGYRTIYGHLSKIFVKSGQKVKGGKLIAKSGNSGKSTGPHLHFSIFKNGVVQNPLDYLW